MAATDTACTATHSPPADWPGLVLGAAAVTWTLYLLSFAVRDRNAGEAWNTIGQLAWLTANWIWMFGELHDHAAPGCAALDCWYPRLQVIAGWLMNAGLIWLGAYFFLLRPLHMLPEAPAESQCKYLRGHGLKPRWPLNYVLSDWRVYENLHTFFWLGKDSAWNHYSNGEGDGRMWLVFIIPSACAPLEDLRQRRLTPSHSFSAGHCIRLHDFVAATQGCNRRPRALCCNADVGHGQRSLGHW